MKKRKLKKEVKIALILFFALLIVFIIYKMGTGAVSGKSKKIEFEVKPGSTYSTIVKDLKKNNLVKSEFFYKVYIKLHNPKNLKAGVYELNSNMNLNKLIFELENNTKSHMTKVTFKEGINFIEVAKLISKNFDITEEEVFNTIKDKEYIKELIDKYWFLTDSINNESIYYALEGYLYPDTYQFDKDSNSKDIINAMLKNTEKKLEKYKSSIEKSKYNIHEILTLASIVELEASNSNDRAGVAGVFYNRLESGWSLGSDVTTYYGLKLSLSERDLTIKELNEYNSYNTRNSKMAGKLPVSPICNPGIESIKAAINKENHDYYYFVADKTGKTYFSKTSQEHSKIISKLKGEGLWYEY